MTTATTTITDQAITETITRLLTKYPQHTARIERGAALLRAGAVRRLAEGRYSVRSQRGEGFYTVTQDGMDGTIHCGCPDAQQRGRGCCHSWAVYAHQIASIRFEVLSRRAGVPTGFAPDEIARLRFVRWLVQSGRVAA